jgi:hypothetical protein
MGVLHLTAPRTAHDIEIGQNIWKWLKHHCNPQFSTDSSHVRVTMPFMGASDLGMALDALTVWNVRARQHAPVADLYDCGVVYKRELICNSNGVVHTCEEWLTIHEIIARGSGDCEDLGPARSADYIMKGEAARAFARPSSVGWHIQVRRADGSIEDPSAKLGM